MRVFHSIKDAFEFGGIPHPDVDLVVVLMAGLNCSGAGDLRRGGSWTRSHALLSARTASSTSFLVHDAVPVCCICAANETTISLFIYIVR